MHSFILASGNLHKRKEIQDILPSSLFHIASPSSTISVIEDGQSFFENAGKKAHAYFEKFKQPTLSDDSGLIVEALDSELGVHTSEFGGVHLTDRQRAHLLLDRMKDIKNRRASFVCILCFYLEPKNIFFFEGRMSGTIALEYKGEEGFGFDPVFIPGEKNDAAKTLGQMSYEWKQSHSHRFMAAKNAILFFRDGRPTSPRWP